MLCRFAGAFRDDDRTPPLRPSSTQRLRARLALTIFIWGHPTSSVIKASLCPLHAFCVCHFSVSTNAQYLHSATASPIIKTQHTQILYESRALALASDRTAALIGRLRCSIRTDRIYERIIPFIYTNSQCEPVIQSRNLSCLFECVRHECTYYSILYIPYIEKCTLAFASHREPEIIAHPGG